MADPEERSATCTSAITSGAAPKAFDTCTCADEPPILVCTICRNVCWLKDAPPLSGDTDQVPVQGVLAAMLFTVKALPTVVIRAAHTMAAHMMASSLCFLIFTPIRFVVRHETLPKEVGCVIRGAMVDRPK